MLDRSDGIAEGWLGIEVVASDSWSPEYVEARCQSDANFFDDEGSGRNETLCLNKLDLP
jgi:hypothetical protein